MDSRGDLEQPSSAVAWGLKDVAWAGLSGVVLFVGVAVTVAIAGELLRDVSGVVYLRGALMALAELVFLLPVWVYTLRRPGVNWRALGLRPFRPLLGCLGAAAFLYLTFSVNVIWALALRWLGWAGQPSVQPLFGEGPLGLALALLGTGIVAPLAEEVFFRGFAFPPLRRRLGLVAGIAINAALFTLLHFTPTVFPPLFVLGIFFCLLYEYTGSLWPGIILHATINTLSVLATYLLPNPG